MQKLRKLSAEEFAETFGESRRPAGEGDAPPFDFWPYFDAIPKADFEGHDCSGGVIQHVWIISPTRFQHVLVNSESENIFMVLVLDVKSGAVFGHRLLDLNKEYGVGN